MLDFAINMSPQSKTYHQVPLPRVLSTPVPAPRVNIPSHLRNTTQHDATFAGKLSDSVTERPETIDILLAVEDKA